MNALLSLLSWLTGSSLGRWAALALATAALAGAIYLRGRSAGRLSEKGASNERVLRSVANQIRVGRDLRRLSLDERRKRLRQWATPD